MTGKRTLQFRFRTLLIATFIVAVPCAWIGRDFWRARRERSVIAMIRAQSGTIAYQHESTCLFSGFRPAVQLQDWPGFELERYLFGDDLRATVAFVYLPITDPSDPALHNLPRLSNLRVVHLTGQGVTDESMDEIVRNRGIQTLQLENTCISPDGLSRLSSLQKLESILLGGNSITDEHLARLHEITSLKSLSVSSSSISDQGMQSIGPASLQSLSVSGQNLADGGLSGLTRLNELEYLGLSNFRITGQGLMSLVNHPTIRHISISNSDRLSPEDIDQFQQRRPTCQVDYWKTEPDGSTWPMELYPERP